MNERQAWEHLADLIEKAGPRADGSAGLCFHVFLLGDQALISRRIERRMHRRVNRIRDLTGLLYLWPVLDFQSRVCFCLWQAWLLRPWWERWFRSTYPSGRLAAIRWRT